MEPELSPLNQFYCDTCDGIIDSPKNGRLVWITRRANAVRNYHSFKIVHPRCCPLPPAPFNDISLDRLVGSSGLVNLLSWIDAGPVVDPDYSGHRIENLREWAEIVRRLQLPFYEEARLYLDDAQESGDFDGANELTAYLDLEDRIRTYRTQEE